jgi:hypothetical protein
MAYSKYNGVELNKIYQHFKGNLYIVTGLSCNAETDEIMVEYTALYGECGRYTRRYKSFASNKDKNGKLIKEREDNITGQEFCFVMLSPALKTIPADGRC